MMLFLYDIWVLFLLFMVYSVCGWIIESILKSIQFKRFVNRGFLMGPYCPVYGAGAVLMTIFLERFYSNFILLFIMAMIICSILEYLTSYVMEKLFNARWWDYSLRKFNIKGRVCLGNAFFFGLGGLFIIYVTNPFIFDLFSLVSDRVLIDITLFLFGIFMMDVIFSCVVITDIRRMSTLEIKDSSIQISSAVKAKANELRERSKESVSEGIRIILQETHDIKVRANEKLKQRLLGRSVFYKRLANAYPNMKLRLPSRSQIRKEIQKRIGLFK